MKKCYEPQQRGRKIAMVLGSEATGSISSGNVIVTQTCMLHAKTGDAYIVTQFTSWAILT